MPTSPSLGFLVSQEGTKLLHGPFHDRLSSSARAKPKQPEQFIKSPHVVVFMNERNCLGSWANTDISSHFSRFVDSCFGSRRTQCPFPKKAGTAVELSPEGRRHGPLLCSAQVLLCYTITSQAGECDSWPAPVQGHRCQHGRCHVLSFIFDDISWRVGHLHRTQCWKRKTPVYKRCLGVSHLT